jgi:ATP-binding cassette, subfamily B, bacterial PglK
MFKYIKDVLFLLGNEKKKLPKLFLFFIGISLIDLLGLGLIGPYITLIVDQDTFKDSISGVIDITNLAAGRDELLIFLGLFLLLVFVTKTFVAILVNKRIIQFGQDQQVRLRSLLMESYQSLPYVEYLTRNSSQYVYSIQQLTQQFGQGVLLSLLRISSDGIVGIAIFIFLAWQNIYALILLLFLLAIMVFFYDRLFKINIKKYGEKSNKSSTIMLQGVHEGLEGFKEIRILGKENYFHQAVSSGAKDFAFYNVKQQVLSLAPRYLLELSMVFFIVLLVSGTLLLDGDFQKLVTTVAMFSVAALRLLPSVNMLSGGIVHLRYGRDAVTRLHNDIVWLNKFPVAPQNKNIAHSAKSSDFINLSLHGVYFSYPNTNKNILKNISLEIKSGESIGFVGFSGSGKTTLIDVMLGLLEPSKGSIKYNNELFKTSLDSWRMQLAYLPQQIFLIDSTLKNNIALESNPHDIDNDRLNMAIQKAMLSSLVNELCDGVDTMIGERGMRLSGGQRQRIALARAFYHQRNVLVMDESTSALDNETEEEIVNEIKTLRGSKTLIIIAHRLTTLKYCDRIYKLEDGKIINLGSGSELINSSE